MIRISFDFVIDEWETRNVVKCLGEIFQCLDTCNEFKA